MQATNYTGTGFDRSHNCPSADRSSTMADNSATFLMTNMMPQAPRTNQQMWVNLEDYSRIFLNSGNEVYIICGSYGKGGTGTNGYMTTLDNGRITIPARCRKVVVILPIGTDDATCVTTSTRVIAIVTPMITASAPRGAPTASASTPSKPPPASMASTLVPTIQQTIEARIDTSPTS